MSRKKRLLLNTTTALLHQIITVVCGFILPRLLLSYFGSQVNGLVSSISQFLAFISFADLGVGAVVQSSLYKPLANGDNNSISQIIKSSSSFYRKVAILFLAYVAVLVIVFPYITHEAFDGIYTSTLVIIISISLFAQYFFGITYSLLLNADQRGYIQLVVHSISLIANTIVSVILLKAGAGIHIVKLASAVVFIIQPILLAQYANRHYHIDHHIRIQGEPIKQKWNGLAQHFASVVLNNTDTVVLTLLSTLENVSVYAVYHLVVNGVKQILMSLTNGFDSLMGNMLAKGEKSILDATFESYEWAVHTFVTILFTVTGILIVPFVSVYTNGIQDTNYIVPTFGILITCAQAAYCLRLPYNSIVLAAGHYKQTQTSAIIEALLNIFISIVLVTRYGLIGVAIGTLVSMIYRTFYLALYLQDNITRRPFKHFIIHLGVDALQVICMILLTQWIKLLEINYIQWLFMAIKVGIVCIVVSVGINYIFYRKVMLNSLKMISHRFSRKIS